jgi:peptidoglycan/xylan/chitin deacetylase (PgdA/CDA1 family)
VLGGAAIAIGGAAAGAVGAGAWFTHRRPPLAGGYAPAADVLGAVLRPGVSVSYYVQTTEPVVAFTFDDGPLPDWTPMVLDALDRHEVPATFFCVGRNVVRHGGLLRGRIDRHEIGNHSWSHPDLATLDLARVHGELLRTHAAITATLGRVPKLMRPPYGHLGGSTLLAADAFGYPVVLWSQQMHEARYVSHPQDQVTDIVAGARPGAIILAHDVGPTRRLVALNRLGEMFAGLKDRGFRMVTVSELLSLAVPAVVPTAVPTATTPTVSLDPGIAAHQGL